jgi:hypothetical protein
MSPPPHQPPTIKQTIKPSTNQPALPNTPSITSLQVTPIYPVQRHGPIPNREKHLIFTLTDATGVRKMCPARLSDQAPGRWSDEEHDILVKSTNERLDLEKKDEAKVIPLARHWIKVSELLSKNGYTRTSAACIGYWKRVIDGSPRWDDAEHCILFSMTKEQLESEETDPLAVISWAKHWKKVSERLKEKGYIRSIDACDVYYKSYLAAGSGLYTEDDPSSKEPFQVKYAVGAGKNEQEDHAGKPENKIISRLSPPGEFEKSISPNQPNKTSRVSSPSPSSLFYNLQGAIRN